MKKSVWIFLFAVLLPSVVLGWLALRSAEEQQIVFERRTAELYQKETDSLAVTVRDTVDSERRAFGETVHRLLAKGDPEALARDFTNTLADSWPMKAVGFAINREGKLISPSVAAASKKPELHRFLLGNGGFLTSTEPAIVYNWAGDNNAYRNPKLEQSRARSSTAQNAQGTMSSAGVVALGKDSAHLGNVSATDNESLAPIVASQSTLNGGFAGAGKQASELARAKPASPNLEDSGAQTIVLNGGVQMNAQVPPTGSAFDFSGVITTPGPQNLNPSLQPGVRGINGSSLTWAKQDIGDAQKKEDPALFSDAAARPAIPPMPTAVPAERRLSPEGATDKNGAALKGMPAPAPIPESTAKPARMTDGKERALAAGAMRAEKKMEPADRITRSDAAKNAGGGMKELKPNLPVPAAPQAPVPGSAFADRSRSFPKEPAPAPVVAPAPKPQDAIPMAKSKAVSFPASKYANGDAAPMPAAAPQKSSEFKVAKKMTEDAPVALTKSSTGTLALNSVISRQVEPQQVLGAQGPALSAVMPEEAEFRSLTEEGDDGLVARFVQDKLNLIFWMRPPEAPEMVFGCLVEAGHFSELWKEVLEHHNAAARGPRASLESKPEFVLALLDDRGKPVATQPSEAPARDWKRPFVASEIGEALPHWEAALYLASPTALAESARGLWRTLAFTIAGMVTLIALGGWLVVADARRQLALAQQKTDFVSNVSHELKTPLTSIRMFAELMHDRPQPVEKQGQYLRIITVEAERLTRLINNVLDFAKIGRKQKRIERKPLDLHAIVARVWESQDLHLRQEGFTTRWEAAPGPYPVLGDEDALAQVLVNLLSNAEKYSNGNKEVELHTWLDDGWVNVSVLDRGMGVPSGDEKKIFEAFYRAHDSLNSGIQGSGLGLTLAQRIAREHEGEIKLEHREGGGSRFTLRLPIVEKRDAGITA